MPSSELLDPVWQTYNVAIVDPVLIGRAKQIKEYRDWIAHQNPKKVPSIQMDAKTTYHVLSQILDQIEAKTP